MQISTDSTNSDAVADVAFHANPSTKPYSCEPLLPPPQVPLRFFHKPSSFLALFACLLFLLVWCIPPNGVLNMNEEVYLTQAEKRYAPEEYGPHTGYMELTNTRLLYEWPYGYMVNQWGSEAAQVAGRLLLVVGLAWTIAMLAKRLSLNILDVSLCVMAFFLLGQDILGGDWIFRSMESKSVAYIFVFAALAKAFERKLLHSALFCAIGTYMHFQAAGNWWLFIVLWQFFLEKRWRETLVAVSVYVLCCLPEFWLIIMEYGDSLGKTYMTEDGVSTNYIYSAIRISHHVAPFKSLGRFGLWAPGIGLLFGLTAAILWLRRGEEGRSRALAGLVCISLLYMVILLMLMAIDPDHALGKLYPFRPSSIALFLILLLGCITLGRRFCQHALPLKFIVLVIILPVFFAKAGVEALEPIVDAKRLRKDQAGVMAYITQELPDEAVLLVDPSLEGPFMHLEREHSIPVWANFRPIPTRPERILAWYARIQASEKAFAEGCEGVELGPVTHLLTTAEHAAKLEAICGTKVYADEHHALVRRSVP